MERDDLLDDLKHALAAPPLDPGVDARVRGLAHQVLAKNRRGSRSLTRALVRFATPTAVVSAIAVYLGWVARFLVVLSR
jgi:anti-sigma factor RsiW